MLTLRVDLKKLKLIILSLMLFVLIAIVGLIAINTTSIINYNYIICSFGLLVFVWSIWSWYKLRRELLCPYIFFLMVAFVFMFGQSMLKTLRIPISGRDLHQMYPLTIMLRANLFTVLSLLALHIGSLSFCRVKGRDNSDSSKSFIIDSSSTTYKAISIVGYCLFFISVGPMLIDLYKKVILVNAFGYRILYEESLMETGLSKWDSLFTQFFVPSLICLFLSSRKSKAQRSFASCGMVLYSLVYLYLGGRGKAIIVLVTLILMWHYTVNPIKALRALISALFGVLVLSILPVLRQLRNITGKTLEDYIDMFLLSIGNENLIVQTLSEMGSSMFPLINVMLLVPDSYPFRFGTSYLYSFTTVIPNLGMWKIHPAVSKANLGIWLKDVLGLSYGPGFSFAAEAYINFGWFGIIVLFILGGFYGWFFSLVDKKQDNPAILVFVFTVFVLVTMITRNSFIGTVRAFLYVSLPLYIAIMLVRNSIEKNIGDQNSHVSAKNVVEYSSTMIGREN